MPRQEQRDKKITSTKQGKKGKIQNVEPHANEINYLKFPLAA
ncbi:hypothetical protein QG37_04137 [Candidozyma auris]|uniref:Uncharacterized protein n=1 Tax=Candidozyma auris TaxID=498019 RepID=A0A0L0NYI7_CANAR|nr:hypothetical protein QG37_04137 [[Candida] auris]